LLRVETSDVGKAIANTRNVGSPVIQLGPHMRRILNFAVRSFAQDYVLLTEGGILDPFYEIWE